MDKKRKTIIFIGAGPGGLTGAVEAQKNNFKVTVLERDAQVGGLAKTVEHNGFRFDIGGHRFFTKSEKVNAWWNEILGDQFIEVPRLSRIYYNQKFFYYPLEPWNALKNVGFVNSFLIGVSFIKAKFRPIKPEDTLEAWVINRFGRKLYETFFKTYTEKVWGIPCNTISAEWAAQRIRGLSLLGAIKNAFWKNNSGEVKTLIDKFRYPVLGPGLMWETAAEKIKKNKGEILLNTGVTKIFHKNKKITKIAAQQGKKKIERKADFFVSTMPIRELIASLSPAAPDEVVRAAQNLNYRDFLTVAVVINKKDTFPDNWIYIHDPAVRVGRIQNFKNWSSKMVPDEGKTCLGLEYFVFENDDLWKSEDAKLIELAKHELVKIGVCKKEEIEEGVVVRVKKAYPVYDGTYKKNLEIIKKYLTDFSNLQLVGRNGLHKYNNQDHSMMTAMLAVKNFMGEKHDLWAVNADLEYLEEYKTKNS